MTVLKLVGVLVTLAVLGSAIPSMVIDCEPRMPVEQTSEPFCFYVFGFVVCPVSQ